MWKIDKEFHFEAGHRVWSQELKHPDLSISTDCACKHLHGHSYVLKVELESTTLDQSGMVTDFKNLNFMKEFIDNELDHKFIIDINDPNFELITSLSADTTREYLKLYSHSPGMVNFVNLWTLWSMNSALPYMVYNEKPNLLDHYRSFVIVEFVPTSENICKYLGLYAEEKIKDVAKVSAVELWETKKSHCRYTL